MMLVALTPYWPVWLTPLIASLALILGTANIAITLWRGTRRVQMKLIETLKECDEGIFVYYRCQVTNTGCVGIQIDKVDLYPANGEDVGISSLRLRSGEKPRKLDQGETQDWEICLCDLKAAYQAAGQLKLVAVATDTTGKKYRQKRKDFMTINLSDSLAVDLAS